MVTLQKLFVSFFAVLLICISSLSVNGETLENVFYGFNKNADRAIEILLKREASNESLSYLRADLFQDRNRALMLKRKINEKYLIQKDELKLIDDLITESSTEGTSIALKRQKLVSILEQTTFELANTKLALKRAERLIKEIDELKKVRFNERFFSFNQLVLFPTTYVQGTSDFLGLIGNFGVDFYQNFNSQAKWMRMFSVSFLPATFFFIGLLIIIFQDKITVLGNSVISQKIKNKNTLVFINPLIRLITHLISAALIINFLQILTGNYGLPILIDALPKAVLIFLLGYFVKTVIGEAKEQLSDDTNGYVVDLSRLQATSFFTAITLGLFTVISFLTERSYLSLESEVTLNAVGLFIIASLLIYGLKSIQTLIFSLTNLLPDMERGLSFISLSFITKGVTALTWVLLIGGIFGYLLIAFEIVKVVSYIAGVIILFVLIDFFLRGLFLTENKKKDKKNWQSSKDDKENDQAEEDTEDWKTELLNIINGSSPKSFENLCQRLLRESGCIDVKVVGGANDKGIDGTAVLRLGLISFPVKFQCKRYGSSQVTPSMVREFRGSLGQVDKGIFITTSRFTKSAAEEGLDPSKGKTMDLIDGDRLCDLLREYKIGIREKNDVNVDKEFFENI